MHCQIYRLRGRKGKTVVFSATLTALSRFNLHTGNVIASFWVMSLQRFCLLGGSNKQKIYAASGQTSTGKLEIQSISVSGWGQFVQNRSAIVSFSWVEDDYGASRGGVENTMLEAKTKHTKKSKAKDSFSDDRPSRGQGQECSRPSTKTKDTAVSVLRKKKVFKKVFRRSPICRRSQNFWLREA